METITKEIDVYHVIPINDIEEHSEKDGCKCKPTIEVMKNGNVVIVHNSFDGREAVEMANDIINK